MGAFAEAAAELQALDIKVLAGSVDPHDKTTEVASELNFPVAWGMTRAMGEQMGSWWDDRRQFIQPSEFLLDANGKVLASSYSAGPIGRFEPGEVIRLVKFFEARRAQATQK